MLLFSYYCSTIYYINIPGTITNYMVDLEKLNSNIITYEFKARAHNARKIAIVIVAVCAIM